MRASTVTLAIAALALAAPVPAAAQGNPLSSIFGCDAGGNKQAGGAVIGGLVGGVVGSNLAKNERTLGAVLGAAAGAATGSYIGCRMQRTDQAKAQAAAEAALNRGGSQSWNNPQTGASGNVKVVSTSSSGGGEPVSLSGLRFASGVEPAGSYEAAGGRYTAPKTANIRGTPSTSGAVVGKLSPGQSFDALARVSGTPWLLAGRDGVGVGYVSDTVVRAAGGGYAGNSVCRTFDQTIRTQNGGPETSRHTACKGADGQWVVQS